MDVQSDLDQGTFEVRSEAVPELLCGVTAGTMCRCHRGRARSARVRGLSQVAAKRIP